jgi:hypothetical protein
MFVLLRETIRQMIQESAKQRYMQMFADSTAYLQSSFVHKFNNAIHTLKRQDRIVWWMRWLKAYALGDAMRANWSTLVFAYNNKNLNNKGTMKLRGRFDRLTDSLDSIQIHEEKVLDSVSESKQVYVKNFLATRNMLFKHLGKLVAKTNEPEEDFVWNSRLGGLFVEGMPGMKMALAFAERMIMGRGVLTLENLQHYLGMNIHAIDNTVWQWQHPDTLMNKFRDYEREWQEKYDGLIDMEEDDQIVINFPEENLAWLYLPRTYCDLEAKAMGHCGNKPSAEKWHRLLSLRERVEGPNGNMMWKSRLTFILDTNTGNLGEMKAYGNQKPPAKYHRHIMSLLMSGKLPVDDPSSRKAPSIAGFNDTGIRYLEIDGIAGGGYEPQNNFSIKDLTKEQREEVVAKKPSMDTLINQYKKQGMTEKLANRVILSLEDSGLELQSYSSKHDDFVVYEYSSLGDAIEDLGSLEHVHWMNDIIAGRVPMWSGFDRDGDGYETKVRELINNVLDDEVVTKIEEELEIDDLSQYVLETWDEGGPLHDALIEAYNDGDRVGTYNEIREALDSWAGDYFRYDKLWGKMTLVVDSAHAVDIAMASENDGLDYMPTWKDELEIKDRYEQNWWGFDEDAAREYFNEHFDINELVLPKSKDPKAA